MNKIRELLNKLLSDCFVIDREAKCTPAAACMAPTDMNDAVTKTMAEVASLIKAEAPAELLPMLNNACADVRLMYRRDRFWREAVDRVMGIEKKEE